VAARHIWVIPVLPPRVREALLLIVALALPLSCAASGQSRAMHVRDLAVSLTVNPDGSLDVNERLSIRFTGRWSTIAVGLAPGDIGGAANGR
jgi:hypothetical protein